MIRHASDNAAASRLATAMVLSLALPTTGTAEATPYPAEISPREEPFDAAFGIDWLSGLCPDVQRQGEEATCPEDPPPPPARGPDLPGMVAVRVGGTPTMRAIWLEPGLTSLGAMHGRWEEALPAPGVPDRDAVSRINHWVNRSVRYTPDAFGDRWAPARETLLRREGDCEDFALLKLALLARAGVPIEDMYLILLHGIGGREDHAVLAVRLDEEVLLLDSRNEALDGPNLLAQYTPILGMSGPNFWTFGYASAANSTVREMPPQGSPAAR